MSVFRQIGVVALGALCSAVFLAAPVSAGPSDDPESLPPADICADGCI